MELTTSWLHWLSSTFAISHQTQLMNQLSHPDKQSALLRKVIDRIRNSLELKVVLQTAVDEVASLLNLDRCSFLWYYSDTQRVQVVCECICGEGSPSSVGYHPLESFGSNGTAIAQGSLIVNYGHQVNSAGLLSVTRLLSVMAKESQSTGNSKPENKSVLGSVSNLLIPLKSKSGWIGFIACLCDHNRHWKSSEIEFLESLAQQLEIAIRQAQLYEQTQKQAQREQLVNQITTQTRQSLNLETILNSAIAQLMEALKADRCLVHLVEHDEVEEGKSGYILSDQELEEAAKLVGFRRRHLLEVCRTPFPPSLDYFDTHGPITNWVIQHRQLVVISDVTQDPRIDSNNSEYEQAQIKSSLVVPVQANNQLHAILYLNQCSHTRYWSKNDLELAQAVADQLAISIHQAYLYARAKAAASTATAQAQQLAQLLEDLQQSQAQLVQTEKMSSLGQLVAGVAHEINNPVNFIYGNLKYANNYIEELLDLVGLYQKYYPEPAPEIQEHSETIDLEFLREDLIKLLASMKIGADRIRQIVLSLRNFSRVDQAEMKLVDLHEGIDNTLLILQNRLKSNGTLKAIEVVKDYGQLPLVECYAGSLNQVFMNIISNAIDALENSRNVVNLSAINAQEDTTTEEKTPTICIRTEINSSHAIIRIADNGPGIAEVTKGKLFDPFFTTKPVGKGTGLGLSISYRIIVEKHKGSLSCNSELGKGTEFKIEIPRTAAIKTVQKQDALAAPVAPDAQPKSR
ncbi:MAG TPA: GAF domain-containing protein [Halomicronema sp.]